MPLCAMSRDVSAMLNGQAEACFFKELYENSFQSFLNRILNIRCQIDNNINMKLTGELWQRITHADQIAFTTIKPLLLPDWPSYEVYLCLYRNTHVSGGRIFFGYPKLILTFHLISDGQACGKLLQTLKPPCLCILYQKICVTIKTSVCTLKMAFRFEL